MPCLCDEGCACGPTGMLLTGQSGLSGQHIPSQVMVLLQSEWPDEITSNCVSGRLRKPQQNSDFTVAEASSVHSEIIDDLTNLVESTDGRLRTQTRHVRMVDKKSTSCGMLVVIVLLLIAIAVVALWPTG
ncbi:hypothetical protein DUI87_28488 [Hirundo rustica rustica]|uniref:t-SNARE coiled-coil homology domain-containing protein n=1 Tax=Hirundo rustica rustica TaxID=333673 RepID=A0A3M0JJS0_HIRRU|nr:hypothetical protein DUI87_28488 [Hirundo rustica rustica]